MHGKHNKRVPNTVVKKSVVAFIVVLALCVSSFATVMANTVSASVIDGDKTYNFSLNSTELDDIIDKAAELGLDPIGEKDVCEKVGNTTTVIVRRGVDFAVTEAGKTESLIAYKGSTVEEALEENNIILKEDDECDPSRDTVITDETTVEISRMCTVKVIADGEDIEVSMVGGTVKDAINELGITVSDADTLNYDMDKALFDNMNIRITRVMNILITADGETVEHALSANSVQEALEKAGIELAENDRTNFAFDEKISEGMEIVVNRVSISEETETQIIEYSTVNEEDSNMYKDESKVKTEGVNGEKQIVYSRVYVDGQLESEEVVSETVTKEPVSKVVVKGTKESQAKLSSSSQTKESSSSTSGSTFTDASGNTVSYSSMLTGTATAYSGGGTTATGVPAAVGRVAVNPNVIPYGTNLYITGYGYAVAADTGGALRSGAAMVDVYFDTESECINFGRKTVNIYILD